LFFGGNFLSIQFAARVVACSVLASLFPLLSAGQQTAQSSSPDPSTPTQAQNSAQGQVSPSAQQAPANQTGANQEANQDKQDKKGSETKGNASGTSNDRLFYTLPNFLSVENSAQLPPLTTKQKYAVVARGTFDPVQYPWWALLSALSQAQDSEPGFGQGWEAYGKRFLTAAADGTIENFITGAVLPSLLHQDPRFFQSNKGGFTQRTFYAVSRIFVTRTDSGRSQFNYSEIVGAALSASISTYSYHPRSTYISTPTNPHKFIPSDRTLLNTADVWGSQVAIDTVTIAVKEFWPDIHRKLSHKNKVDSNTVSPKTSNPIQKP
jgi:hypothetical protein